MLNRTLVGAAIVAAFVAGWALGQQPARRVAAQTRPAVSVIATTADVRRERAKALRVIFGGRLPAGLPPAPRDVAAPLNAALAVELIPGRSIFLTPAHPNGRLAVWHAGHQQDALIDGAEPIRAFLDAGFNVIAMNMPPAPHDVVPMREFLEPVALSLNYAQAQGFHEAIMAGLSGGGWTTTVYAALDARITRSIPIAGSLPKGMNTGSSDQEQELPGLDLDYLDLYLMAASDGRQQLQILNAQDSCCFSGSAAKSYREFARARSKALGGSFDVLIIDHDVHEWHPAAIMLATILEPSRSL